MFVVTVAFFNIAQLIEIESIEHAYYAFKSI